MPTADKQWLGDGLTQQHTVFGGGTAYGGLNDASASNGITSNVGTKYNELTPEDSPDDCQTVTQISIINNVTKPGSVTAGWQYSLNSGASWSTEQLMSASGSTVTVSWIKLSMTKAQFDAIWFRVRSTVASSDPFYLYSAFVRITYLTAGKQKKVVVIGLT